MRRENFTVHVVDSDQAIADGLATLFGTYGIEVLAHADAASFLAYWLARRSQNCCLVTDADPPGPGGPALLRKLHELQVDIPVLVLASTSTPDLIEVARSSGRISVIRKPCLDRTLTNRVLGLRARWESGPGRERRVGEP